MKTEAVIRTRQKKIKSGKKHGRQVVVVLLYVLLFSVTAYFTAGYTTAFASDSRMEVVASAEKQRQVSGKELSFSLTEDELEQRLQIGEQVIKVQVPEGTYIKTDTEEYGVILPVIRFYREELKLSLDIATVTEDESHSAGYDLRIAMKVIGTGNDEAVNHGIYQISMTTGSETGEWMMSVWNRYQNETEEGGLMPVSMFREEERYRLWEFEKEYGLIVDRLQEEISQLFWSSVSEEDLPYVVRTGSTLEGKVVEFTGYFTQLTGIGLQYVCVKDSHSENSFLFDGDLLDALVSKQISLLSGAVSREDRELVKRLIGIGESEYVAVVPEASELKKREDIPYVFWGTLSNELASEEPEAYQDRLLSFDSVSQMTTALDDGELGGILIRKELYTSISEEDSGKYRMIPDSSIIVEDYLYGNLENVELNQLFNAVISEYRWNERMGELFRVSEEKAVSYETADYLLFGAGVVAGILFLICLIRLLSYSRSMRHNEIQENQDHNYSV